MFYLPLWEVVAEKDFSGKIIQALFSVQARRIVSLADIIKKP
jgi:hypothetical protein